jgi:membrane-bound serine protease (ClpP class)
MEVFVIPGFGVCGVGGILLVIASLALAMVDNEIFREFDGSWNLRPLIKPLAIVTGSAAVALFGSMWLVSKLYATRSFDHIALRQEMNADEGFTGVVSGLESLSGCNVTVFTDMRPGGKVKTDDGRILEATLKFGGFASKGTTLKVLYAEQGRLYCEII